MGSREEELTELVDKLKLRDEDRQLFVDALLRMPEKHAVRGYFLNSIEPWLTEYHPKCLVPFSAYRRHFAKASSFAWFPATHFFLLEVCAAKLVYPDKPLIDAMRDYMCDAVVSLRKSALFRPLLEAADGDPAKLMKMLEAGAGMHVNFGQITLDRVGKKEMVSRVTNYSYAFATYALPGINEGYSKLLGVDLEYTIVQIDESTYDVEVRW